MGCKQSTVKPRPQGIRKSGHDKKSCNHNKFKSTSPAPRGLPTSDNNKEPKLVAAWALPDEQDTSLNTMQTVYNPGSISIKETYGSRESSQALKMDTQDRNLQRYSRGQKYHSVIAPSYDDSL
ncbi:uncharacterized protein TM35_000171180 [Trypanosoma theileri]|uniref:Uncharacterized protein n=1 Tax=Trypanosoma theileri TaxID=67003 RepID=A0A1X0NU62_9TRYP|nr:uncharacterized protein TM35_000171180 [Trypanosoma theileri]ORC88246.1 hypothetical protein TM35_000171180 [Trypanosoma theileri]